MSRRTQLGARPFAIQQPERRQTTHPCVRSHKSTWALGTPDQTPTGKPTAPTQLPPSRSPHPCPNPLLTRPTASCVAGSWWTGDWSGDSFRFGFVVRRVSVPARGDHGRGPLVPAIRPPTVTSRSCSPSVAWTSITSPSTGGSSGSHPSSSKPPGRAATALVTGGSSTRPTSRSPAGGRTCTGPSTSTARSSTYGCPTGVTSPAARAFFNRALRWGRCRSRSPPTGRRSTRGSWTSWSHRPCTHGAVCEQRGRGRPWPTQGTASPDARPQAVPVGSHPCRRSCFRPEPPARSL